MSPGMYPEELVQPMRAELTQIGFDELRSSQEVDEKLTGKGTTLVVVNSICGCAARMARPAVRMALQQSAAVAPVQIQYDGRTIAGTQVSIDPFVDDPLRSRFQQLADKHYAFIFSPDVPGQLYRMQTQARSAQSKPGDAPVLEETITLTGEKKP